MRKIVLSVIAVSVLIVVISAIYYSYRNNTPKDEQPAEVEEITNYEQCVEKGNKILEIYPEQCVTEDGKTFTRVISENFTTVAGKVVCLPHKDAGEVQTLECAYGLRGDNGNFYGLVDKENKFNITQYPIDQNLAIYGSLDKNVDSKYDIEGNIEITNVMKL